MVMDMVGVVCSDEDQDNNILANRLFVFEGSFFIVLYLLKLRLTENQLKPGLEVTFALYFCVRNALFLLYG